MARSGPSALGAMLAIAGKDVRLLMRDRWDAFFTFVFPVAFALFFGAIFGGGGGGPGGLGVVVVDEDASPASARFVAALRDDAALRVSDAPSREAGETLVRRGKVGAMVVVPKGFGAQSGSVLTGGGLTLEAVTDPSRRAEMGLLQGKLTQHGMGMLGASMTDPAERARLLEDARETVAQNPGMSMAQRLAFTTMLGAIDTLAGGPGDGATADAAGEDGGAGGGGGGWTPVQVSVREVGTDEVRPRSAWDISFPQGLVWGLMGCVTGFATSLAQERSSGTMRRLRAAPIGHAQVLVGKALACALACLLVQLFLLAVFVPLGVRAHSVPLLVLVMVVNAIGFTGLMMLMAGITTTAAGAGGMGRALILVLAMVGGGTVPLFVMPQWMQTASGISPFKWGVLAMEGATWRGLSLGEIALPLCVLLLVAAVGLVVGARGVGRE